MSANLLAIFYLISGILFILALRGLSSPETSRQGNYFGIAGMTIAIVVTFLTVVNFGTNIIMFNKIFQATQLTIIKRDLIMFRLFYFLLVILIRISIFTG